jgi:hypothetical protein
MPPVVALFTASDKAARAEDVVDEFATSPVTARPAVSLGNEAGDVP